MNSSIIHDIINDIRLNYAGKTVSMIDIRRIENKYKICSIVNTRYQKCAFLRITCYATEEMVFEDVVFDYSAIEIDINDVHEFIFKISKLLYEGAYNVLLVDEYKPKLRKYSRPSIKLS